MPELLQGIELDKRSNLIMIVVLYVVIGFGIFGTFLMMTKERTYEFGILIAVGMRKLKIQLMVASKNCKHHQSQMPYHHVQPLQPKPMQNGRVPATKHDNRKLFVGGLPNEGK